MQTIQEILAKKPEDRCQNERNTLANQLRQLKQFNQNFQKDIREDKIQQCINHLEYQNVKSDKFVFHQYESTDYIYIAVDGDGSQIIRKEEKDINEEKDILIQIQNYEQLLQQKQQNESTYIDLYVKKIDELKLQLQSDQRFSLARKINQILSQSALDYCVNQTYYFDKQFPDVCLYKEMCLFNAGQIIGEYTGESLRDYSVLTNTECHFMKLKTSIYYDIYKKDFQQKEILREFLRKLGLISIQENDIESLSYNIERIEVQKDQIIIKQGDKNNSCSFGVKHLINPSLLEENSSDPQDTIEDTKTISSRFGNNDGLLKNTKSSQNLQEYKLFQIGEGEIFGIEEIGSQINNITVFSVESHSLVFKIKLSVFKSLIDKRIKPSIDQHGQNRMERILRRIHELQMLESTKLNFSGKQTSKISLINNLATPEINPMDYTTRSIDKATNMQFLDMQNFNTIFQNQDLNDVSETQSTYQMRRITLLRSRKITKDNIVSTPISNKSPNSFMHRSKGTTIYDEVIQHNSPIQSPQTNRSGLYCLSLLGSQNNSQCQSPIISKNELLNLSPQTNKNTNTKLDLSNNTQQNNLQFSDLISQQYLNLTEDRILNDNNQINTTQNLRSPSKSIERKVEENILKNSKQIDLMNPHQFFHQSKSFSQTQEEIKFLKQKSQSKNHGYQFSMNSTQPHNQNSLQDIPSITNTTINNEKQIEPTQLFSKMLHSRLCNFLDSQKQAQKKKEKEKADAEQKKIIKQKQISLNRIKNKTFNNFCYLKIQERSLLKKMNAQNTQSNPQTFNYLPEDSQNISSMNMTSSSFKNTTHTSQTISHHSSPYSEQKKQKNGIVYFQFECQQQQQYPLINNRAMSLGSQKNTPIDYRNPFINQNQQQLRLSSGSNNTQSSLRQSNNSTSPLTSQRKDQSKINDVKLRLFQNSFDGQQKIKQINKNNDTINLENMKEAIHDEYPTLMNISSLNQTIQTDKSFPTQLEFKCNMNSYHPKYRIHNSSQNGKYAHNQQNVQVKVEQKQQQNAQNPSLDITPIKKRTKILSNHSLQNSSKELKQQNSIHFGTSPTQRVKKQKQSLNQIFLVDAQHHNFSLQSSFYN